MRLESIKVMCVSEVDMFHGFVVWIPINTNECKINIQSAPVNTKSAGLRDVHIFGRTKVHVHYMSDAKCYKGIFWYWCTSDRPHFRLGSYMCS